MLVLTFELIFILGTSYKRENLPIDKYICMYKAKEMFALYNTRQQQQSGRHTLTRSKHNKLLLLTYVRVRLINMYIIFLYKKAYQMEYILCSKDCLGESLVEKIQVKVQKKLLLSNF